jgi:glycosyltransferase involved in cell wall biosynthesis
MAETGMKIHILVDFIEGPWGGGNQFLKALREYLRKAWVYSESPEDADVILFNSYPFGYEYLFDAAIKLKMSGKLFIYRVDGPVYYVRGKDRPIDKSIYLFNNLIADGTIFQSRWSRDKNYELGIKRSPYETIIMNAPDPSIFNREGKRKRDKKVRLIATSWSENVRRGFDIYRYLDDHLDFSRYEMTFVGNSPVEFKNIKWIKPVPSQELAGILREHDIYIAASRNDPCSNALIEALHCGLLAVARNDGGHPEIIGKAGVLFEDEVGAIEAIERVARNYADYQVQMNLPSIAESGKKYYDFAQSIYQDCSNGGYHPRHLNFLNIMRFRINAAYWKNQNKIRDTITGLKNKSTEVLS